LPHPDLDMVNGALRGDAGHQDEFVARLRRVPRVLAYRNGRLGGPLNRSELEELAQEVVGLVWAKLGDYAGLCSLDGWVYRFCVLALLGHIRKLRRRPTLLEETGFLAMEPSPERDILQYERMDRALLSLDPTSREIVRQRHYEDRTFEEIAGILDIPRNTVKTRYYRGLIKLRKLLEAPSTPRAKRQT